MSPLFDYEDLSFAGGPDVPLPSFLRDDDRADVPGPSDVGLMFQPTGPYYRDVRVAQPAHSAPAVPGHPYAEPARHSSPARDWDPLFDPWPLPAQPGAAELSSDHPSGPLPLTPGTDRAAIGSGSEYDVTLTGALGSADLGFRAGWWFSLGPSVARPISTRDALRAHPTLGGPIVQVVCWWMREHPTDPRALDIATELAFAVGELSRGASRSLR